MIKLRIRVPEQPDRIVTVAGDELTIGRNPECDVVIEEAYVSARHAKLVCGLAVADLESTNGIWVKGERMRGTFSLEGTRFQLGPAADTNPSIKVLEARAATAIDPAELQRLRLENDALKLRLEELEAELLERVDPEHAGAGHTLMMPMPGPKPSPPGPKPSTAIQRDVPLPEAGPPAASASPEASAKAQPSEPRAASPASAASAPSKPMPAAVPASLRGSAGAERAGLIHMIDKLVREDVGDQEPMLEGPLEEFFTLESFRLLRQVEKVITRLAREFNQLYDMNTMLPDTGGNFRSFAADVLLNPDDRAQRQKLVEYLDDIRRWLAVTLAANRKAAQRLIAELKAELSSAGLTSAKDLPLWRRITGSQDSELWRRAQSHLKRLDEELIEDRLDHFAKEFAIDFMEP